MGLGLKSQDQHFSECAPALAVEVVRSKSGNDSCHVPNLPFLCWTQQVCWHSCNRGEEGNINLWNQWA